MTPAELAKAARHRSRPGEGLRAVLALRAEEQRALLETLPADVRQAWNERLGQTPYNWEEHYQAIRAGLFPKPSCDALALGMARGLASFDHPPCTRTMSLADRLRACRDLLDDEVWRLFRIGSAGGVSLAGESYKWDEVLCELAKSGDLPRGRLLDASLAALALDFSQHEAGWFSRFHEKLEPTAGERAERADGYAALLTSQNAPTVTFALAALQRVPMSEAVAERLVSRSGSALTGGRGAAKAALKLLGSALGASPKLAPMALREAVKALHHSAPDVQSAAWKLLSKPLRSENPELVRLVHEALPVLSASLANDVRKVIGDAPVQPAARVESEAPAQSALDPLDESLRLDTIESIASLCERASAAIEAGDSGVELELIVDAVGRLHLAGDPDQAKLGPPLRLLADARFDKLSRHRPLSGTSPVGDVCFLIGVWLGDRTLPARPETAPVVDTGWLSEGRKNSDSALMRGRGLHDQGRVLMASFSSRVHAVAKAVKLGRPAVTLSTPTHRGGWLCPLVLVERLERSQRPHPLDFAQALLRVGTRNRDRALAKLAGCQSEHARILEYALGGEGMRPSDALIGPAAEQARAGGPDLTWTLRVVERRYENRNVGGFRDPFRTIEVRASSNLDGLADGSLVAALADTAQVLDGPHGYDRAAPSLVASMWPGFLPAFYARGARLIADDYDEGRYHELAAFLERLLEDSARLEDAALLLLGVALGSPCSEVRVLGIEALASAIAHGRWPAATDAPSSAPRILGDMLELDVIVPSRWVEGFAAVVARSPQHRAAIRQCVTSWLSTGHAERFKRSLGALLELLYEASVADGVPIRDPRALEFLSKITGNSSAARLARRLQHFERASGLEKRRVKSSAMRS